MTRTDRLRRSLRGTALTVLKGCGAFHLVQKSDWRRQRLLILCYHGISIDDEHEWRPFLYIRPQQLEQRLDILHKGRYSVLPLGEALERLYRNDLPQRSVSLTFDDGTYDFYSQAYPRLKKYGFPLTVYLTTYYSELELPVFSLICSYMFWKARGKGAVDLREFGLSQVVDLSLTESRQQAADQIVQWADRQNIDGRKKNEIAAALARKLGIDYAELLSKRSLQLMNRGEVKQLADAGVDFQLHTHRHRMPVSEELFRAEIRENRAQIAQSIDGLRQHFCYPSGAYRPEFLSWLAAEEVVSAATCDTGMASIKSDRFLLPRLVDTSGRTDLEFESWVNGIAHFLSAKKRARLAFVPD
jgi:peptidoglycan/xylan/chitin deacetylase (PgdA/CDA1 family)